MKALNPYLNFNGNTEEVFRFYQSVFGGELTVIRYRDAVGDRMGATGSDLDKIMHISLPMGPANVLMGTDTLESQGHGTQQGNNFFLNVDTDDAAEAERLFARLLEGGTPDMELQQTDWAERFGSGTDRYGIRWMINYTGKVEYAPAAGAAQ